MIEGVEWLKKKTELNDGQIDGWERDYMGVTG
jgi:hypothetical protein